MRTRSSLALFLPFWCFDRSRRRGGGQCRPCRLFPPFRQTDSSRAYGLAGLTVTKRRVVSDLRFENVLERCLRGRPVRHSIVSSVVLHVPNHIPRQFTRTHLACET